MIGASCARPQPGANDESEAAMVVAELQAALEKKKQDCDQLKSLVEKLRIEKALQQQESAAREAELQAKCDELQSQLHITNVNESWHRRTMSRASSVATSDYGESQVDEMADDSEAGEPSLPQSSSTPAQSFGGNNSTASNLSTMRRAASASDVTSHAKFLDSMDEEADDDGGDDYSKFTPQHRKSRRSLSVGPVSPSIGLEGQENLHSGSEASLQQDEAARSKFEADALTRVRETHRKCGDRNVGGFLRELGVDVEGGWNPTESEFERIRKRGLILCHPDKQLSKTVRERCLFEAIFKELNEWTYKAPIDRPGNGFAGQVLPRSHSPSPRGAYSAQHRRTSSHLASFTPSYGAGVQSSIGIASRLTRRSMEPARNKY